VSKPQKVGIKRERAGEKGILGFLGFLGFMDLSSGDEFGVHHTINSRVISTINLGLLMERSASVSTYLPERSMSDRRSIVEIFRA
jgi:hypothetical protein